MRTKIIASLGPSSRSRDVILGLARAGASGFRINFAHGGREEWDEVVESVRSVEASIGKAIALIGDLRGISSTLSLLSLRTNLTDSPFLNLTSLLRLPILIEAPFTSTWFIGLFYGISGYSLPM